MPLEQLLVVVATPTQVPATRAKIWLFDPANSELVAKAVGTAVAPVPLPITVLAACVGKSVRAAALIAVPLPFKSPVMVVLMVNAGVAPPPEEPAKPLADATDTAVTVPCG